MISAIQPQLRAQLAAALGDLDDITVYPHAPVGVLQLPAVVLGMPRWTPDAQHGMDRWEWPVVVVVAMAGANPEQSVTELDAAWPVVVNAINDLIWADQTLGGIVSDARITGAQFGPVSIAGKDYPAQSITLTLYNI